MYNISKMSHLLSRIVIRKCKRKLYAINNLLVGSSCYHLSANRIAAIEMATDRWGQTLIKMIFQLFLDIWISRNHDGHYLTDRNESQLSRERLIIKIIELQESNPEVRYCNRDFVFCPMETLENYSVGNLTSWLRAAKSIIKAQKQYRTTHQRFYLQFLSNTTRSQLSESQRTCASTRTRSRSNSNSSFTSAGPFRVCRILIVVP